MKYFDVKEFVCRDGTPYPKEYVESILEPFVVNILDPIREAYGAPIVVTSGYRTSSWNFIIGGAQKSRHIIRLVNSGGKKVAIGGDAADIAPAKATRDQVVTLRNLIHDMEKDGKLPKLGGFGAYPRWVHVDARPRKADGGLALWNGSGIGSEKA